MKNRYDWPAEVRYDWPAEVEWRCNHCGACGEIEASPRLWLEAAREISARHEELTGGRCAAGVKRMRLFVGEAKPKAMAAGRRTR